MRFFWKLPRELRLRPRAHRNMFSFFFRVYARLHRSLRRLQFYAQAKVVVAKREDHNPSVLMGRSKKRPKRGRTGKTYLYGPDLLVSPILGKRESRLCLNFF